MSAALSDEYEINSAIIGAALASTASAQVENSATQPKLAELYALASEAGIASSLDALNLLSVLLPCKDPGARDLIALMGEHCSAKEVVMATQEAAEKTAGRAQDEDDPAGDDGSETKSSWSEQLGVLVMLYQAAIPRMPLRKKTASEVLGPLLLGLRLAMEAVSDRASPSEARSLLETAGNMTRQVLKWARESPGTSEEVTKCQSLLKSFLDAALSLFRHAIGDRVAHKAFEICFPRLRVTEQAQPLDNEGWKLIDTYVLIYADLGYELNELTNLPSLSSIVLLVHSWLSPPLPTQVQLLPSFTPSVLTMLHPQSTLQDDALAFLMLVLHGNKVTTKTELSPGIISTLAPPLVALSSTHPVPQTRHQAFRILSLLAASGPSQLRLHLLADLVANCEFPQMRVAAVGLVKDAVLEALALSKPTPSHSQNLFGTPIFMKVFGPILFRPSPPDLFDVGTKVDLEEFLEGPESKKIVEVLSLYYVILMRDKDNMTGIRDQDMLDSVEKNLLSPLRRWLGEVNGEDDRGHMMMPLVSLKMGLNRAEEARGQL